MKAEPDVTLFDELSVYIGEDDANTIIKIIEDVGCATRVVHVKEYYVLELTGTVTPKTYTVVMNYLSKYVALPPMSGRAVYLKLAENYAIVCTIEGTKLHVIVIAKSKEDVNHEASNHKNTQ